MSLCCCEAALEIVLATCSFWEALDGFKVVLMRGVSKRIKDSVMKPPYIAEVVFRRYMLDLDAYLHMRRNFKMGETVTGGQQQAWSRPPPCPWHDSNSMLMVNWNELTHKSIPWDWTASESVRLQRHAGLYLTVFKRMMSRGTGNITVYCVNQAIELLGMMKQHLTRVRLRDLGGVGLFVHTHAVIPPFPSGTAAAIRCSAKSKRLEFISSIVRALEKDIDALVDKEVAGSILDNRANEFD
jgi:hypothetical protein